LFAACKSQKETQVVEPDNTAELQNRSQNKSQKRGGRRGGPPNIDEVFKMDTDNDGMISKAEVKGRLADRFSEIDADGDGYITRDEFEKAPRPKRGSRGSRNN